MRVRLYRKIALLKPSINNLDVIKHLYVTPKPTCQIKKYPSDLRLGYILGCEWHDQIIKSSDVVPISKLRNKAHTFSDVLGYSQYTFYEFDTNYEKKGYISALYIPQCTDNIGLMHALNGQMNNKYTIWFNKKEHKIKIYSKVIIKVDSAPHLCPTDSNIHYRWMLHEV